MKSFQKVCCLSWPHTASLQSSEVNTLDGRNQTWDTWHRKAKFHQQQKMGKILRFFTWHVPFTSLESSKVATSIYTMAVLSKSPGPTDTIRYADTHGWIAYKLHGYISFIIHFVNPIGVHTFLDAFSAYQSKPVGGRSPASSWLIGLEPQFQP